MGMGTTWPTPTGPTARVSRARAGRPGPHAPPPPPPYQPITSTITSIVALPWKHTSSEADTPTTTRFATVWPAVKLTFDVSGAVGAASAMQGNTVRKPPLAGLTTV